MPHLTRDPMLCAGHLLVALQSIVSRDVDPLETAVVSMCMIEGGMAANQIPDRVVLRGTCRTFKPAIRDLVARRIEEVSHGIAAAFGLTAQVTITVGMGATVNDPVEADRAAEAADAAGLDVRRDLPPSMASEDFGWYLAERPGAFAWIGNGPARDGRGLHNPGYDFNDAILPVAATFLAEAAKAGLKA